MSTCKACGLSLIKQPIKKDGSVLTAIEHMEYDYWERVDSHTLECETCGNICYHSIRRSILPPENGSGKCKRCGGNDLVIRPKWMGSINAWELSRYRQKYIRIWSCPIHGIKPIMK